MKKSLFLIFCSVVTLATSAQTSKGDKIVGAYLAGISYTNSDNSTSYSNTPTVYDSKGNSFSISINPTVGWFLADNLAVGGEIGFGYYYSKSKSSNTSSSSTSESKYSNPYLYLGPFARYYFGANAKGKPFAEVGFGYNFSPATSNSSTSGGSSSETKTKSKGDYNAGIKFGYEQFITDNIGIFGSLGVKYNYSKYLNEYRPSTGTGYDYTTTSKRVSVPINVGFQIHLTKKGKK